MKLGKREVDAATCPPGKRDILIFDDEITGFALRVTTGGTKIFLLQYRRGSKVCRLVLGRYGDITPTQARTLAERARGLIALGRDPVAEKVAGAAADKAAAGELKRKAESDAFTLEMLVQRWDKIALADRSAAHRRDGPAAIRRGFRRLLTRPAASVTVAEAQRAVDAIAKDHAVMARRTRDYARSMGNWAMQRRLLTSNPFGEVVVEAREISRDRVLSDAELAGAWRAAGTMPYPFGPLFRLLILTLQRRQEVAGMRWAELSDDLATWTLSAARAKNRRAHLVHLTEPARAILAELAIGPAAGGEFVFSTTGGTPVSGFTRATDLLHARCAKDAKENGLALPAEAERWRLHDFRRTGVTALARLGIEPHVADRLLNHVVGTISGVAAIYQRHEFLAERARASEVWAAHVLAVAGDAPPANVVQLAARRGRRRPPAP